jgi:CRISPR-associated protein Csx17
VPDLRLSGCGSRPLIGYLKALGLLRAVSRQADASARGRWDGTAFELRTTLSERGLAEFLLNDFEPSPVLSPWNGGSGFYARANPAAVKALGAIEQAEAQRFAPYQSLIADTRRILSGIGLSEKPGDAEKESLVRALRASWSDEAIEWLDAAIVIAGDSPAYPPLLGTGGNEGRYDFSVNYMQAIVSAFSSPDLLDAALLGSSARLDRMALAHFQGDFSPTNSPAGDASSLGNPWDLVVAVEGSLALVGGAARRHADGAVGGVMTAPFTVRSTAAGYGAAVAGERGRAELWLPLWNGWATYAEITNLVRESRAQVKSGRTLRAARSGLDFARAAGELGVARGIDAFERYTILERSGQSNLAVPAGRIEVAPRPSAAALASIDPWLGGLLRFGSADNCPTGVAREIRRLERACFQMAARGEQLDALAALEHMGVVEGTLARSSTAIDNVRPLRGANAGTWIAAADDGSPEFAAAASIASMRTDDRTAPTMRDYLHGTTAQGREFDRGRRHLISAPSAEGLLAAIHARSHLESQRTNDESGARERRLGFERGTWCDLRVSRLLATGRLDGDRVVRLARGLVLLEHRYEKRGVTRQRELTPSPAPAYDMLALAWWGRPPPGHPEAAGFLGARPGWAARLAHGAAGDVLRDASIRLRTAGMTPVASWRDLEAGAPPGELLAAALLSPLGDLDAARLHKIVTYTTEEEDR